MKNSSPLHDEYILAVLLGALIFATGYFVRDFATFSTERGLSSYTSSESTELPPPPPVAPPAPPLSVDEMRLRMDLGAVVESMPEVSLPEDEMMMEESE